jgi:hypothetical protein
MTVLITLPAIGSATMAVVLDNQPSEQSMSSMHGDQINGGTMTPDEAEKCHQMEKSDCCEDECGCCVAHVFPVSPLAITVMSFSRSQNHFLNPAFTNVDAKRLIRPPRYI